MTNAEILQLQVMNRFWNKLCDLSDSDLMVRRQMEIEQQGNLKKINEELNRRNREQ